MAQKALSLLPLLLLTAAGLVGLLLLCIHTRDVREPPGLKYGIVLDAGSSHTSMFVYKWPADKENDTGIVGQHSHCDVKGGGISSFADNPPGAGLSLLQCLEQALRDVPKERHTGTPLYLGATAGMRLLELTSPQASAKVLAAVRQTLRKYPFDFRGAHILSGQDEGVFGWVTVNYLLENFIKYNWVGQWLHPGKVTLGAMDLGGASTQITFETDRTVEDPANSVQLQLYGQRYHVYTQSFLCYGLNQVLWRLLARVLQTTPSIHPCWPRGYVTEVRLQDVYGSPCTAAQRPQSFNNSASVSIQGGSNPVLCRNLVAGLFNFSSCHFSRCSFNGIFQPPVTGEFIAFSAFFHITDFLKMVMRTPITTLKQLEEATVVICNQDWKELQGRAQNRSHLTDYCAGAMFVHQLLSHGYHFDEHTFSGVTFQKKARDTAVGWALGYMLNLTNMIPADPPRLRKSSEFGSWVALLLLFSALLLAALVLLLRRARTTKSSSVH